MSIQNILHSKMNWCGNNKTELEEKVETKGININDFKMCRVLGKGAYAKVRVAIKKDNNRLFAIKCYSKQHIIEKKSIHTVLQERKLLEQICHPFCIRIHWAFQTDTELFMVMDLLHGGDLRFHLERKNKFSHSKLRFYLPQIALAVDYLHSLSIVHRDIKPENIALDYKGNAVLIDMGLARKLAPGQEFHDKTGTAAYMAPEVWSGLGYATTADWWSLGVTFYELITGKLPFELNKKDYKLGIILTPLTFPSHVHPIAMDLLSRLLEVDPQKRMCCGILGINELKRHPFFEGINWEKLLERELTPPFVPKEGFAYCDPSLDLEDLVCKTDTKLALYDKDIFAEFDYNTDPVATSSSDEKYLMVLQHFKKLKLDGENDN